MPDTRAHAPMTRLILVVVVVGVLALARAQTPAPTLGGFCLPTLSCDGGFCNTAPTQSCTSNDTATLEAECPCQCTTQCTDPAESGEFCQVRDCWAGECKIMNISHLVCDTYDVCTSADCFSNTTTNTSDCTAAVHTDGCCQTAAADCTPPVWLSGVGVVDACQYPVCANFNASLGYGACSVANETSTCCTAHDDCVIASNLCLQSSCVNMTMNEWNLTTGVCTEPVALSCADPNTTDLCLVGRCNATNGMCENVTLGVDECAGACCVNATAEGCYVSSDKAWCDYDNGTFFPGQNCSDIICATPAPTPEPTAEPTHEPTLEPSAEPSAEPTREPTPQPTLEPTAEPTLQPTPAPTQQCVNDTDCPSDPNDKCLSAACINGTCSFVDKRVTVCPFTRPASIADDPCYENECDYLTGLCRYPRFLDCCTNETDGLNFCHSPGGACTSATCLLPKTGSCVTDCGGGNRFCTNAVAASDCAGIASALEGAFGSCTGTHSNESCSARGDFTVFDAARCCASAVDERHVCTTPETGFMSTLQCNLLNGSINTMSDCCDDGMCVTAGGPCLAGGGTCGIIVEPAPECCESHDDCTAGDLCSMAYCNHASDTCVGVNTTKACPDNFDLCTDPLCNSSTGECGFGLAPDQNKCPRACCFGALGTCSDLDFFNCTAQGGVFFTNETCASVSCPCGACPGTPLSLAHECYERGSTCMGGDLAFCGTNGSLVPCTSDAECTGLANCDGTYCLDVAGAPVTSLSCSIGGNDPVCNLCYQHTGGGALNGGMCADGISCTVSRECSECTCFTNGSDYGEPCIVPPTPAPPTAAPTPSPTATAAPTDAPTDAPTPAPTPVCGVCPVNGGDVNVDDCSEMGVCEAGQCLRSGISCLEEACDGDGTCACAACACVVQPVGPLELRPCTLPTPAPTPVPPTSPPTPAPTVACPSRICPLFDSESITINCTTTGLCYEGECSLGGSAPFFNCGGSACVNVSNDTPCECAACTCGVRNTVMVNEPRTCQLSTPAPTPVPPTPAPTAACLDRICPVNDGDIISVNCTTMGVCETEDMVCKIGNIPCGASCSSPGACACPTCACAGTTPTFESFQYPCVLSTLAPTPAPTAAPTGACCASSPALGVNSNACFEAATEADCNAANASALIMSVTWYGGATCGGIGIGACSQPDNAGCCVLPELPMSCTNDFGSMDCVNNMGTYTALGSCTMSGACITPTPAPTLEAPPTVTVPASAPPPTAALLVPVQEWYAAYTHTLCRLLHACGDGDEQPCLPGAPAAPAECSELECCAVSGVP